MYRSRRLLTKADERLDDRGRSKLLGLLDAGDPKGEVRTAWHAKGVVRTLYDHHDPNLALEFVPRLGAPTSTTARAHRRSVSSVGPSSAGVTRSPPWHRRQVSNGFHVVRTGNRCLDKVRGRVQNETLGHLQAIFDNP